MSRSAAIQETLKRTISALDEAQIPFLIGGSLAELGARRAGVEPRPRRHDPPADAKRAQDALVAVGMRPEDPPESWLLKAWDGEVLVDLIFEPAGLAVDDDLLAGAPSAPTPRRWTSA